MMQRPACSANGSRIERIMPSAWVKQVQPSFTTLPMKLHSTRDRDRNGM